MREREIDDGAQQGGRVTHQLCRVADFGEDFSRLFRSTLLKIRQPALTAEDGQKEFHLVFLRERESVIENSRGSCKIASTEQEHSTAVRGSDPVKWAGAFIGK